MASSSSKMTQIYVGIGVLAVLGGLYYMNSKKEAATTNTTFTQGSKSSIPQIKVVPEEVDRLTVKAKDKPQVVLEKKDGNWTMVEPTAGAKVQKSAVEEILNALKAVTFKDSISAGESQFGAYDLDEIKGVHVVAAKAGSPVMDIWFGKQASRGQLVRLGSDPSGQIWSVNGAQTYAFDKSPKDVREKRVWDLSRDSVTSIDLHDAKGTFVFTKNVVATADAGSEAGGAASGKADAGAAPAWTAIHDGKPIKDLDSSKVDDMLSAFAASGGLNADDFGDGKSDNETGLGGKDATALTFHTKEGTQRMVLGRADGARRFARRDGDTTIFILTEGPSGWAEADVDKFVTAKDADAGTHGGKK